MLHSGPTPEIGVVVTSDQALVAETVGGALNGDGISARAIDWPSGTSAVLPDQAGEVGLLMSDLDTMPRVDAARSLISRVAIRWVVLTSASRGPLWGAALDAGAWSVLPSATGVKPLRRTIARVSAGELRMGGAPVERLRRSWRRLDAENHQLIARFNQLSPREREILMLLQAGDSVTSIAELLGTADTTVRSQIKSLFRKLGVGSQLAAVASCTALQELGCDLLASAPDARHVS